MHGVDGRAEEVPDPEVPLDPLEEELDLPAHPVEVADVERGGMSVLDSSASSFWLNGKKDITEMKSSRTLFNHIALKTKGIVKNDGKSLGQ